MNCYYHYITVVVLVIKCEIIISGFENSIQILKLLDSFHYILNKILFSNNQQICNFYGITSFSIYFILQSATFILIICNFYGIISFSIYFMLFFLKNAGHPQFCWLIGPNKSCQGVLAIEVQMNVQHHQDISKVHSYRVQNPTVGSEVIAAIHSSLLCSIRLSAFFFRKLYFF